MPTTKTTKTTKKDDAKKAAKDLRKLRATVEKLEAKVEKLQGKADRWKGVAKTERAARAKAEARLRRATTERPRDHGADGGDVPLEAAFTGSPDASWTVVRLRVLARERGVTGASRMSKAQLLQRLAA